MIEETRASKTYCPSGSSDAILALVKMEADVNAVDRDGLTALHCAASRGHVDCLETLITLCGAEVNKVDESGCSALFYAVTLGHADCTNLLLTFGSQASRQDNKGRTPAHCGAAKGQLETLKILNHHKANLWMRNSKGDMPLHEAVQSGRKDLVEWLLLQHQGSVNVSNSNGRTPLHIAAITNNVDMCKVLMDYGAFINPVMKNSKNQLLTPLDAALHRGNRGCAKYLNLHGALPASKLLEKREYNRFTEAHLSNSLELSPNAKRNLVRDTSAQTELHLKDVDIQARVDLKSASASADLSRGTTPIGSPYGKKNFRCSAVEGTGKPIIAKVYVHTKRSKIRRMTRKPTAYRRDCPGEKLSVYPQQRTSVSFQESDNRASNNQGETETPHQTDHEKEVPSRKASQPILYEEQFQSVPEEMAEIEQDEDQEKLTEQETDNGHYNQEPDSRHYDKETDNGHYDQESDNRHHKQEPGNMHYDQEPANEDYDQEEAHHKERNDDNLERDEDRSHLLSVEQRRRSSLRTQEYDLENHSPLSSIRSLESTIKDSGFSDDVDRGHQPSSSEDDDDNGGHSDSEAKYGRRRNRRHIARYVVSSGAAETFRLEEDDEEDKKVTVKPRSSSLPHMRKKEEHFETCPRLLNRPTLTKEVQRSLKKYQMERRLFYELQELKRKQITSSLLEEREVVQKMVDRFRNHVLSPYMTDFQGPLTFHAFEKYLYEQLRKLSMGGKIPKPKPIRLKLASCDHKIFLDHSLSTAMGARNSKAKVVLAGRSEERDS
ncbi:ankycorbin [Trichonephila clavipes]|nr:ankycorbin [Trichonephila clavipes]